MMENLGLNVSDSLEKLCKINKKCSSQLSGLLSKQIWSPSDRKNLLHTLSLLLLHSDCTEDITRAFRLIILEIVCLAKEDLEDSSITGEPNTKQSLFQSLELHVQHQIFSVAIAKIIGITPEVKGVALSYLTKYGPFFAVGPMAENQEPVPKKAKKTRSMQPNKLELVHATCLLMKALGLELRDAWDWSDFLVFLSDENVTVRWYAVETVSNLLGMSPASRKVFRERYFTELEINQLSVRCDTSLHESHEHALLLTNPNQPSSNDSSSERLTHTMRGVTETDLSDHVTCVCGVVLPQLPQKIEKPENEQCQREELVLVPSTQRNLRCVALAVAAGSPVLLEGPVGCGKTSLVEHIAMVTGHGATPHLMKIQLGDQTDSKALLGTYRCTEVPGEFVWQPGALTTAVREGYWVLLEDLDYAPMDVISLLLPLLESRTLTVPGHGDRILAHADFRIFATIRLLSSGSGWYKQHSAGADILEKQWTRVNVEPLSRPELQQVIVTKHPQLATVGERLLDVYFLLSSGRHEISGDGNNDDSSDSVGRFISLDGRLISTRDLLKWCSRIAADFDVASSSTANLVFQEALDCFCACIAKSDRLLPLAENIGSKLNITKVKAEFYCLKHKPNVEITTSRFTVGRVSLSRKIAEVASLKRSQSASFAFTRQSVSLLERVAVSVSNNEPVLLVGETGTGKTSSVQYLAQQMGHTLRVVNMNQQSDSTDLLGGFKPVDIRFVVAPFREDFELTFCRTFSRKQNTKFLGHVQECFNKKRWLDLFKLMDHTLKSALQKPNLDEDLRPQWEVLRRRLHQLKCQVKQTESALAFSFIEGTLVKALKRGDWVLLDEINLATAETLECLSGLLESSTGSIVLLERGDTTPIVRHPDFRLFACMNPATDVGKKDLPPGVRNRFTELYMSELEDPSDLKILVAEYLKGLSLTATQIDGIVKFYLTIRNEASKKLVDGTGHKPCYSLRTLCRALQHAARNPCGNVPRSLYEGFCLSFLTQLDRVSHPVVQQLVAQHVLGKQTAKSLLKQPLPKPPGNNHLMFEGYWVGTGSKEPETPDGYILTPSVRANLRDLARVVSAGKHPVLLQGETSVGKTSLITWLAQSSGNVCMRINNHEHTDIQEYVGCYSADETGKLVFKEGILVEAMRKGYWVILDELNLAPTDVLEALNRLLDDNRELFIAETQDTVKAHPHFMLFATQNPPGQYGGRKILSRAFRNRFVELHFSELPSKEVETILHERCSLPLSYAKKLVAVMVDLQTRRRGSGVFAGKQGYITLRDLFRWAERYKLASYNITEKFFDWDQQLADNGYMLLAGRVRREEELKTIQEVIEKHIKRRVDPNNLFSLHEKTSPTTHTLLQDLTIKPCEGYQHIVWTAGMRRMAVLVSQALKFGEPVLLVGETGCGKTTICQLYAHQRGQSLRSVNCHLHTEGADFLGGLRPVRQHAQNDTEDKQKLFEWCDGPLVQAMREGDMFLIDEISLADDSVLERLNSVLEPERMLLLAEKGGGDGDKNEIDIIIAEESFRVIGTMNPGGDYGKKELSPALRNRFTEIWCPLSRDPNDMVAIIEHNLHRNITLGPANTHHIAVAIVNFVEWFSNNDIGKRCTVSIRDILTWTGFINIMTSGKIMFRADSMETNQMSMESGDGMDELENSKLDTAVAYIHGACMVFLDALGSGVTSSTDSKSTSAGRQMALKFLVQQLDEMTGTTHTLGSLGLGDGIIHTEKQIDEQQNSFGIIPFYIPRGPLPHITDKMYALSASTTCMNAQRVLRALQLPRPILLEGSPGVGKTSLVTAIARASGNELIRINLSEQTDVSDLFGADLPVEGGVGGQFAWRDGPLLRALKAGHWVVLDELNLASQSVLEGLNACLDHRGEVYIPELGRSFQVKHEQTRLFACQNPLHQGGGRKGLPRSFLNRFTQVYVETLSEDDLVHIVCSVYSELPKDMLRTMVQFNQKVHQLTMTEGLWGQRGGPWEFNLRDVFRWCDLLQANQCVGFFDPAEYMSLVYTDRMRTASDKYSMTETYREVFSTAPYISSRHLSITTNTVQVGHSFLQRKNTTIACGVMRHLDFLHHILPPLESLMMCIDMNWMALLVGPSASGKTSMVQLLAQLVGHPLHILPMNSSMDTTELLGGFEQMDLHRHLEVIVSSLEGVMYGIMAQLLSKSDRVASRCHSLLRKWHKFLKYSKSVVAENSTEELEIMRNHLSSVEQTITTLEKMAEKHKLTHSDDIDRLKQALSRLSVQIENGSMTRHGGTFEWIDSILVKALQEGHWLLIDNVNFCSPSVLDRLNALLEPNGVLSITERGVIDGEIPTIKPHPDFRLILAMDPRHGEISRAMRNRGLEIYTLGEEEGGSYDNHDLETMLNGLGLVGHVPAHTLITLHEAVRQKSFGYTRFSVTDLLRVGLLTVQQLERGAGISAAMYNSAVEVYVRPLKDFKCRKVLSELVLDALGDLDIVKSEKTGSSLLHLGLWPDRVPSIDSYCLDVTMATTHKSTAVFMNVLNQCAVQLGAEVGFPLTCQQLFEEGVMTSGGEDLDQLLCHIPHAVQLMLEQTSIQHWKALCLWLEKVVPTRTEHIGKEVSSYAVQYYRGLPGVLITALKASFDGPVMEEIESIMAELCTVDRRFQDWNESAFDVRWNESFLHSLKIHSQQNLVFTENLKRVTALCNQLYLMVQLEQSALVHTQGLDQMSRVPKKNEISALKLSYAVNTGLMEADKLPDPVIIHLYPMIRAIDNDLLAMYKQPVGLDDSQLNQIRQCLMTYDWFVDLCKQPMGALDTDLFISSLALHWTWLWDELLKNLIDSKKLSVGTIPIVTALHNSLGTDSQASRLHQALSLAIGHPKPFSHQAVAQNFLRVRGIATGMNFTSTPGSKVTEKLALLQKEGDIMRVKIMDIAHRLLLGTEATSEEWINQELSILEKTLTEYKLQSPGVTQETAITMDTDQSPDNTSRINVEAAEVSLLPISDYMAVITETCILEDLLKNGTLMRKEDISDLLDFALEKCSLDPCQLSIWQNFMMSKADHAVPTCELMLQFLHSLWSSTATNNIDYWLSWKPGKDALELQDSRKTQEISSGPEWLSSPILSHMAFFLLTEKSDDLNSKDKHRRAKKHVDTWLPSNIPAGKASEKLVQLSQMSHSLAAAAGLVAKPAAFRSSCISIITSTLQHLFSVLVAALDSNHQGSAQQIIQQLDGSTRSLVIAAEWFLLTEQSTATFRPLLPGIELVYQNLIESLKTLHGSDPTTVDSSVPEDDCNHVEQTFLNGQLWVYGGMLQTFLLAPQGPVDPAYKLAVQLDHAQKQIRDSDCELYIRGQHHTLLTGLEYSIEGATHPLICHLVNNRQKRKEWVENHENQIATRPVPPQFHLLLQDSRQFLATVCSMDRLVTLCGDLQTALDRADTSNHCTQVLKQQKAWLRTVAEFVRKMESHYPHYRDIVLPFISAVKQIEFGIATMGYAVQTKIQRRLGIPRNVPQMTTLEDIFLRLCKFPFIHKNMPNSLAVAEKLLDENTRGQIELIVTRDDAQRKQWKHVMKKLLFCSLHHVQNHLSVTQTMDCAAIYSLSRVFHLYVAAWRNAEQARRLHEEEKAAFYKYRAQTHGESLTEEERDQQEIEKHFPSFDQEFDDITIGFTLDDDKKKKKKHQPSEADNDLLDGEEEMDALDITQSEMSVISNIHQMAFVSLTFTAWHQGSPQIMAQELSYVQTLLSGYLVAAQAEKQLCLALDPRLDAELLGSHLVVSQVLQDSVKEAGAKWKKQTAPYDVYYDPNVPEAVKCRPLLERFSTRVLVLLEEWPDHPTLKQLIEITRRILGFPMTSPIMKFVTGLEILLQKAQEWESNAARHVSLADHMESITHQIIEWRKLELKCWQSCLDTVQWKCQQKAAKWWFHLYQLLEAFIAPPSELGENNTTTESERNEDIAELTGALKQYMEGSSLGEYTSRLAMLEAFHYQMTHISHTPHLEKIGNLLWNLQQHYQQFVGNVEDQISKLRAPIEKQLKAFVKIARWNDINYYAVKQAVEKTHKTLHRSMKAFETILSQPISSLLTEDSKPDWSKPSIDSDQPASQCKDLSVVLGKAEELMMEKPFPSDESQMLSRLPTLTSRFRKHCRRLLSSSQLGQLSTTLDEFAGEVIESVHDLQALEITQIKDKEKQKSEAKHIHLRKRRALADLFKYLQTLGLSHRKGLTALHSGKTTSDQWLLAQPLDVSTGLQQFVPQSVDGMTSDQWQGCDKYYRRCLSRRVILHAALAQPSKELGLGNIDRCKGFSEHLTQLILTQRAQLTQLFAQFLQLRHSTEAMTLLREHSPRPQTETTKWRLTLKSLCDQAVEVLHQVSLVMQCYPHQSTEGSTLLSPFPTRWQCKSLAGEDQGPQQVLEQIQELLCRVQEIKTTVDIDCRKISLITSTTYTLLQDSFSQLEAVHSGLDGILVGLTFPDSGLIHPLARSLSHVSSNLNNNITAFNEWNESFSSWNSGTVNRDNVSEFTGKVDGLVTNVLLVVQGFIQELNEAKNKTEVDNGSLPANDEEQEDAGLLDGHVTDLMHKTLLRKVNSLQVDKITHHMSEIIKTLSVWSDSEENYPSCLSAAEVLYQCTPLMALYCGFVQGVLTEYITAHRATSKLLSVLLALFSELTLKGFCLPAEFSSEMGGEGSTDFEDIEGGGLGEGEGAKDVTDQIETEDQLEDTRRQGEEKKEDQDHKEDPDINQEDNAVEMSDNFDGKLHDLDAEGESGSDSEPEDDKEHDLDREMGDLEGDEADKLDEQIWGSDDEEEEQTEDKKEEVGPGAGQQSETELVAKDDNQGESDANDNKNKQEPNQPEDQEEGEEKNKEINTMDESEYNENEVDPHYDSQQQTEPEAMDLPEEMNLDENEAGQETEDLQDNAEENPHDIDKVGEEKVEEMEEGNIEDKPENKEDENTEEKEGEAEPDQNETRGEEPMETEEEESQQDKTTNEEKGFEPKSEEDLDGDPPVDPIQPPEGVPQEAVHSGKTEHDTANVEQSEDAKNSAGQNDQEQNEGTGQAETEQDQGHQGQQSTSITRGSSEQNKAQPRPGRSHEDRSAGTTDEKIQRRLQTVDTDESRPQQHNPTNQDKSDLYEHIKQSETDYDTQTLDAANQDQEQPVANLEEDQGVPPEDGDDATNQKDLEKLKEEPSIDNLEAAKLKKSSHKAGDEGQTEGDVDMESNEKVQTEGDKILTMKVQRGNESTIHTDIDLYLNTIVYTQRIMPKRKREASHLYKSQSEDASDLERKFFVDGDPVMIKLDRNIWWPGYLISKDRNDITVSFWEEDTVMKTKPGKVEMFSTKMANDNLEKLKRTPSLHKHINKFQSDVSEAKKLTIKKKAEGTRDKQVQEESAACKDQIQAAEEDHSEPDSRSLPEYAKIYDEAQQAIFTEKLQEYFAAKSVKTKKAKNDTDFIPRSTSAEESEENTIRKLRKSSTAKSVKTKKAKDDNPPEYPSSVTSERCDDEEDDLSQCHDPDYIPQSTSDEEDDLYSDPEYIPASVSGCESEEIPCCSQSNILNSTSEEPVPRIDDQQVTQDNIENAEHARDNQVQDNPVADNELQDAVEDLFELDSRDLPEDAKIYDNKNPEIFTRKLQKSFTSKSGKAKKCRRIYNVVHSCRYCRKLFTKIQTHLENRHRNEEKVREVILLRRKLHDQGDELETNIALDIRRKQNLLRFWGDHVHNKDVMCKKKGELLLNRSSKDFRAEDYGPCPLCFEWILIEENLSKHQKYCPAKVIGENADNKKILPMQDSILAGEISHFFPAKKVQRVKWTEDEEAEIRQFFKRNFDEHTCPKQKDCNLAISQSRGAGGFLHLRYWETIKKKVANMVKKH